MATYSHIVRPSNGPKLWPVLDYETINPSIMRRSIGRPKTQRNKSSDEPKNFPPRALSTVKCKRCGKLGHNVRTCKGKTVADRAIPNGGNKKRKKSQPVAPTVQVNVVAPTVQMNVATSSQVAAAPTVLSQDI